MRTYSPLSQIMVSPRHCMTSTTLVSQERACSITPRTVTSRDNARNYLFSTVFRLPSCHLFLRPGFLGGIPERSCEFEQCRVRRWDAYLNLSAFGKLCIVALSTHSSRKMCGVSCRACDGDTYVAWLPITAGQGCYRQGAWSSEPWKSSRCFVHHPQNQDQPRGRLRPTEVLAIIEVQSGIVPELDSACPL